MDILETWIAALPTNEHGRRALTLSAAKEIAATDLSGWYIAPFCLGWTVGKAPRHLPYDRYFHIVQDDGEPLFFDTAGAAQAFLRTELNLPRVPIVNCITV